MVVRESVVFFAAVCVATGKNDNKFIVTLAILGLNA